MPASVFDPLGLRVDNIEAGQSRRVDDRFESKPAIVRLGQREGLDLASNDYLGLRTHRTLIRRAGVWGRRWGAGAGSSRLIYGGNQDMAALERRLAELIGLPEVIIMASGFQTNISVLDALCRPQSGQRRSQVIVYSDHANHASIHIGCRGTKVRRYRHLDNQHLQRLLDQDQSIKGPKIIVTETLFSMDGDSPDLRFLRQLADAHRALLYCDDAHAAGILGRHGMGLAPRFGADIIIGTFGKAYGVYGAYVACSKTMRQYLIERCAGLIYSTALPPMVLGAIEAALDIIHHQPKRRRLLWRKAAWLRRRLIAIGIDCGAKRPITGPIIPVITGGESAALRLSLALANDGFIAPAIRPPTVPVGQARLRLSVKANHSWTQLRRLVDSLKRHWSK